MRIATFMCVSFAIAATILVAPLRADTLSLGTNRYEGSLNGIRNRKISITIRGKELQYELGDLSGISLDEAPKLSEAEAARADEPKKSAALYKQVIPTINKPELKLLVELRAIDPTDRDARFDEAVALFLDVYEAAPTDAVWNSRPSHLPGAGSKMLDESARRVTGAIHEIKSDDAKKNLRKFLLDIYTKAGNTAEAQRVAREISTGIAEGTAVTAPATAVDPLAAALGEITAALSAKQFEAALKQADALLASATGENAVELLACKAQALEGQEKPKEAAATWLRIYAHYPVSTAAPAALLNAARIEKKLNDPAAKTLFEELLQKYPASKEAALVPRE